MLKKATLDEIAQEIQSAAHQIDGGTVFEQHRHLKIARDLINEAMKEARKQAMAAYEASGMQRTP